MSGSKKGRKLRPYRTGTPNGYAYAHVLFRSPEEAAADAWEYDEPPTTREMLDYIVAPAGSETDPNG